MKHPSLHAKQGLPEQRALSARRIEFIGLPGSGKTFLLKRLLRRDGNNPTVVHFKDRVGERRLTGSGPFFLSVLRPFLPHNTLRRRLRRAYKIPVKSLDITAMLTFAHEHEALLAYLLRILSVVDIDSRDKVFLLDRFLQLCKDYQLAVARKDLGEWLLFDESFAQKAVSLVLHAQLEQVQIKDYIAHVPKPDALVVCVAPEEVIKRRLDARGWPGWVNREKGDETAWLARCRAGVHAAVAAYSWRQGNPCGQRARGGAFSR